MGSDFKTHIILNDLKNKGIDKYTITEHVFRTEDKEEIIKVSNRELVYVHYFSAAFFDNNQSVIFNSATKSHVYTTNNCETVPSGAVTQRSVSDYMHKHLSDIKISNLSEFDFFIHYYKITF